MIAMVDKKGIEKVIPHRGDMLLIDEVREHNSERGISIRYVRDDEFWCAGHFPGSPIMPGVLQIEAMAQTACFIAFAGLGTPAENNLGYFTTIDKVRFSKMVKPGDVLEFHVELLMKKLGYYKFKGIAKVGDDIVSEATFSAIIEVRK